MLNGTSSVLYGHHPRIREPRAGRTHAFAIFYTGGSVGRRHRGLCSLACLGERRRACPIALAAVSCIALTTVPMGLWALRPAFPLRLGAVPHRPPSAAA